MIAKIFGYGAMLWGTFWAVRPELLRDRLFTKAKRKIFWVVAVTLVYPFVHFFGKELGAAKTAAVVGGFWAGMKFLKDALHRAFERVPLVAFRVLGFLNVVAGGALVWWPKG